MVSSSSSNNNNPKVENRGSVQNKNVAFHHRCIFYTHWVATRTFLWCVLNVSFHSFCWFHSLPLFAFSFPRCFIMPFSIVRLCVIFICPMLLRKGELHLIFWFCSSTHSFWLVFSSFYFLFCIFFPVIIRFCSYSTHLWMFWAFRQFIVISKACDQRTNICVKNLE